MNWIAPAEKEMQEEQAHRLTQIFRYLKEIDQIKNPVVRDVRYQWAALWFRDLPDHPQVEKGCPSRVCSA